VKNIIADGGLELILSAMNDFPEDSNVQAAGCWVLATIASTSGMLS